MSAQLYKKNHLLWSLPVVCIPSPYQKNRTCLKQKKWQNAQTVSLNDLQRKKESMDYSMLHEDTTIKPCHKAYCLRIDYCRTMLIWSPMDYKKSGHINRVRPY